MKTIENLKIKKSSRKSLWHVPGTLRHPGKCLKFGADPSPTSSISPAWWTSLFLNFSYLFLHRHRVKIRYTFYVFGYSKAIFQSKMVCNTSNCRFLIELQLLFYGFSLKKFPFFWDFIIENMHIFTKNTKKIIKNPKMYNFTNITSQWKWLSNMDSLVSWLGPGYNVLDFISFRPPDPSFLFFWISSG